MVAAEVESGIGQHLGGVKVVGGRPLEVEEDQLGADGGRPFLRGGHRGTPCRVVGGGGEREHGVMGGARHRVLQFGHGVHRLGQLGDVEVTDAAPQRRESVGEDIRLVEQISG